MSTMTRFVTKRIFTTKLTPATQERILKTLDESLIYDRYAANIEDSLRKVGEHKLARRFLEELE